MKKIIILLLCINSFILFSQQWQFIGPPVQGFTSIPNINPLIVFAGDLRSSDGGFSWKKIILDSNYLPIKILCFTSTAPSKIFYLAESNSNQNKTIFSSDDYGLTFNHSNFPPMEQLVVSSHGDTLVGLLRSVNGLGIAAATIFISIDGGYSWHSYTDSPVPWKIRETDSLRTFDTPTFFDTRVLAINPTNSTELYFYLLRSMEVVSGTSWEIERFYKSDSTGSEGSFRYTIDKLALGVNQLSRGIEIEISPFKGDTILVETNSEIVLSTDRGENWIQILSESSKLLQTMTVDWIKGIIYFGAHDQANHSGAWVSKDFGKTWRSMNIGFQSKLNVKIIHRAWNGNIYAVTGDGLYEWNNSVDVKSHLDIPTQSFLEQNYPNPFTQMTNIELGQRLAGAGLQNELNSLLLTPYSVLSFRVYDVFGREVLDLSKEVIGQSSLVIRDSQLPSQGIYFYRLTVGNQSQTRMMMFIK